MNYGVIVGRFQIPELHSGHVALIDHVVKNCDQVLCFVAVPRTNPTKRNPLDFETRRLMLINYLPPNTIILPIFDEKSDETWSKSIDQKIASIIGKNYSVKLYSGHGGFLDQYNGTFPKNYFVAPLSRVASVSTGTIGRAGAARLPQNGQAFRSGVIYGISNQFSRPYMTVDCAILYDLGGTTAQILLGRKPKEKNFRFPGGFVERGESLEKAVKREVYEETNRDVNSLEFIGSFPVDDWRYWQDTDTGITTALFAGWTNNLATTAGDDLAECEWFAVDRMPVLEPEHEKIKHNVLIYLSKKGYDYADTFSPEPVTLG